MHHMRRRARLLGSVALLLSVACLAGASTAQANVPGPITTRVMTILNAAGSSTTGMYLKEVGGPVIAAQNENFAFGPASSIKVLLHLYAHDQVQAGAANYTDQVTLFAGASGSCPNGAAVLGTENLIDSAEKMMKVSDNPATRAQYEHWAPVPGTINAYATASGSRRRSSRTTSGATPATLGSTATRRASPTSGSSTRASNDSSLISGASGTVLQHMSGREQFEDDGFDFTGIWPILVSMSTPRSRPGCRPGCGRTSWTG